VLILTARDAVGRVEETTPVRTALVKPFALRLLARIRALLRRTVRTPTKPRVRRSGAGSGRRFIATSSVELPDGVPAAELFLNRAGCSRVR
jgi:DNA-binding response OmpR family regulator